MAEVKLRSSRQQPLKPLVEAALQNELRLLEVGAKRCQQKLDDFEKRHQLSTQEFIRRYENNQIAETLEFAEWIGEHRLLERLMEKVNTLREIQFAD